MAAVWGLIAITPFALPVSHAGLNESRCLGERVTIVGTARDDVIVGTPRADVIDGHRGDDRIVGGSGDDTLCGGRGHDILRGGDGVDFLAPGAGRDFVRGGRDGINVVSYRHAPGGIAINLRTGIATGWGRDDVRGVHQIVGSPFGDRIIGDQRGNALLGFDGRDRLVGGAGGDALSGGPGDDTLLGGAGVDYAAYVDSREPVEVDLREGRATGEGNDQLATVEGIFGSPHDDTLAGDPADNEFVGGIGGDDELIGRGGDDVMFRYYGAGSVVAGSGTDTVYYEFPGTIDLVNGTATGADYSDRIAGVENVSAGGGRHVIVGDDRPNALVGGGGRDVIGGAGADDRIMGQAGADVLSGGAGVDQLVGGPGDDTCVEGEDVSSCETKAGVIDAWADLVVTSWSPVDSTGRCIPYPGGLAYRRLITGMRRASALASDSCRPAPPTATGFVPRTSALAFLLATSF